MVVKAAIQAETRRRGKLYAKLRQSMGVKAASRQVGVVALRPAGRKPLLSEELGNKLREHIARLQEECGGSVEITALRIHSSWRVKKKPSLKTLRRWLSVHAPWKRPKGKAQIKTQDLGQREKFAKKVAKIPAAAFKQILHVDGHTIRKVTSQRAQIEAGRRRIRGQYRVKLQKGGAKKKRAPARFAVGSMLRTSARRSAWERFFRTP